MEASYGPQFFSPVARRYAQVIVDLPQGMDVQVEEELRDFERWAQASALCWQWMIQPMVPVSQRLHALQQFCASRALCSQTMAFLQLLTRNKRLKFLSQIVALVALLRQEKTCTVVHVASAVPLPPQRVTQIQNFFEKKVGTPITVHSRVDKSLLMGAIFLWRDFRIDASLQGMLQRLAKDIRHER